MIDTIVGLTITTHEDFHIPEQTTSFRNDELRYPRAYAFAMQMLLFLRLRADGEASGTEQIALEGDVSSEQEDGLHLIGRQIRALE